MSHPPNPGAIKQYGPAPRALAAGRRIYAIGDVHGCLDRLVALHWKIRADLADRPVHESVLVHLGDYVDRGPDSAGVVGLLAGMVAPPVTRRVDLMGNHEEMMLLALDGGSIAAAGHWLDNGGEQTLESYRVDMPAAVRPADWRRALPAAHLQWLRQRALYHREDDYLFVHAGIRPGVPLRDQKRADLLWIREPFLSDRGPRDLVVVHGHTIRAEPELFATRIGIDTGAVMGGALTCLVLEGTSYRIISA